MSSNIEYEQIRNIILLETDKNKKGDLFNRLAYDVFHALGFESHGLIYQNPEEKLILYYNIVRKIVLHWQSAKPMQRKWVEQM